MGLVVLLVEAEEEEVELQEEVQLTRHKYKHLPTIGRQLVLVSMTVFAKLSSTKNYR